ncbi:MAG: thiolase family protein [Nitrospinae bacterium]|nr:thiolase family protein [Nitrospinota bacterium]
MKNGSFIYSAVRTPIGQFNGALSSMAAPDLASAAIKEALRRAGINGDQIGEVLLGNVLSAGIGQAPARQAALKSGLPETVAATTINKVCGSGMKAVMMADQSLRLNQAQFIVAGGMESMSRAPFLLPQMRQGRKLGNAPAIDSMIHDGLCDPLENDHMGELSEKISQQHGISRENQDTFAAASYRRARTAQDEGILSREIVSLSMNHKKHSSVVDKDEQPYTDDPDQLPLLPPVFDKQCGTITKGNGAKISDGAAVLVIGMKSSGHTPLARITGYATHAQSSATFALAPVEAIRKVLQACNLGIDDIDLFEINEAFAAMSLIVNQTLGLDPDKVNIHGGSIALGHPIGATGARILVTLINALQTRGLKRGLASLCIGGGEATAMVIELV